MIQIAMKPYILLVDHFVYAVEELILLVTLLTIQWLPAVQQTLSIARASQRGGFEWNAFRFRQRNNGKANLNIRYAARGWNRIVSPF